MLEIGMAFVPRVSVLALLGVLSQTACQHPTDLGHPCTLRQADGGPWLDSSATDDHIYQGTPECENLVCIRPAGATYAAGQGICSNLCTPKNAGDPNSPSTDCDSKNTGLVCRPLALDQAFINQILKLDGGAALLQLYLGSTNGEFCTTKR
jgi:hypothetical protein